MKFTYPFKEYLLGLFLNVLIMIYGSIIIYTITFIEGNNIIYGAIYMGMVILFIMWFFQQLSKYRKRYILVEDDTIRIVNKHYEHLLSTDNIDHIIVADHQQLLKIHRVIHIYTLDGNYCYITGEINKFNQLKNVLENSFSNSFVTRSKVIRGNPQITKDFLLSKN